MKIRINEERILAWLVALPSLCIYIAEMKEIIPLFGVIQLLIYPITYTLGFAALLVSINKKKENALVSLSLIMVLVINALIFPATNDYLIDMRISDSPIVAFALSDLMFILFISIPAFCLVGICEPHKLEEELENSSLPICLMFILTYVYRAFFSSTYFYYMNIAYGVIPWILFAYCSLSRNGSVFVKTVVFTTIPLILLSGCRGAALTVLLFLVVYHIIDRNNRRITKKKIILTCMGVVLGIVLIINIEKVSYELYSFLKERGFTSRTLELFLGTGYEKGLLHYEDRENLQTPLLRSIRLGGYGLYGDRLLTKTHTYAHNVILEWLIDFGWLIGGVLSSVFISRILNSFKVIYRNTNQSSRDLLCVAVAVLCCKYMFSASYLHAPEFWFLSGLVFIANKK